MNFITKFIFSFLIFSYTVSINAQTRIEKAVLFGEHAIKEPIIPKDVIRIFLDRNGHYYPDNIILDNELKNKQKGKTELHTWAKNHSGKFKAIAKSYNLLHTNYNNETYKTLQDSIVNRLSRKINNHKSHYKTFLIHGFNKQFYNKSKNKKSITDNLQIEKTIKENYTPNKNHLFIEIYWDGLYAEKRLLQGKIFAFNSLPNAKRCGYSLRK